MPGDAVIGFSDKRASQAELVLVEAGNLTRKPEAAAQEHGVKTDGGQSPRR